MLAWGASRYHARDYSARNIDWVMVVPEDWAEPDGCHWPLGFRPVLRMVVAADRWIGAGWPDRPRTEATWPGAFLTIATACAAGHPVGEPTWSSALGSVVTSTDQEQEWVVLLLATPLLLINANPQGHRRSVIQAWGQSLGLRASTLVALEAYFQLLGRGNWGPGGEALPWTIPSGLDNGEIRCPKGQNSGWGHPPFVDFPNVEYLHNPNFKDLVLFVASLQGQALPALTLAHRRGWPSAGLALVGVLSSLRLGAGGLPLAWLVEQSKQGTLGPSWRGYTIAQVDQLADALYQRWLGMASGLPGERL